MLDSMDEASSDSSLLVLDLAAERQPTSHGDPATLCRQPIGTFGTRASAAASRSGSNSTSGRRSFR